MTDSHAWKSGETSADDKRHAPATLRNGDAIISVLKGVLPQTGVALEIASGSGEHIVRFARAFPNMRFQPSDRTEEACRSIAAWSGESGLDNIAPPKLIDVLDDDWYTGPVDAVLCINMVHISPWSATEALFHRSGRLLQKGAPLYLYGPYFEDAVEPAPSNIEFDQSLRSRNAEWGIRNLRKMRELARETQFDGGQIIAMPANNLSVIYHKL